MLDLWIDSIIKFDLVFIILYVKLFNQVLAYTKNCNEIGSCEFISVVLWNEASFFWDAHIHHMCSLWIVWFPSCFWHVQVKRNEGLIWVYTHTFAYETGGKIVVLCCIWGFLVSFSVLKILWNRCENDCLPSINWVLELARIAVLRHGVNGLLIDPYNELDHQRPPNQ